MTISTLTNNPYGIDNRNPKTTAKSRPLAFEIWNNLALSSGEIAVQSTSTGRVAPS